MTPPKQSGGPRPPYTTRTKQRPDHASRHTKQRASGLVRAVVLPTSCNSYYVK